MLTRCIHRVYVVLSTVKKKLQSADLVTSTLIHRVLVKMQERFLDHSAFKLQLEAKLLRKEHGGGTRTPGLTKAISSGESLAWRLIVG